jgi:hypothetical protein
VHFATLKNGKQVAVKVLRPGMKKTIDEDLALMQMAAGLVEKVWADSRRLKPREVVAEFDKYLHDELDLMREAAQASQLRRNFAGSNLLMVPEMYWDYCSSSVIVMERMNGIPISQTDRLVGRRRRPEKTVERWRRDLLHPGLPRRLLPRRYAPREHPRLDRARDLRPLHRARLRHRRHPERLRQGLPVAELPGLLPARLQARGRGPHRIRLGAARYPRRRTRSGGARLPASRSSTVR